MIDVLWAMVAAPKNDDHGLRSSSPETHDELVGLPQRVGQGTGALRTTIPRRAVLESETSSDYADRLVRDAVEAPGPAYDECVDANPSGGTTTRAVYVIESVVTGARGGAPSGNTSPSLQHPTTNAANPNTAAANRSFISRP